MIWWIDAQAGASGDMLLGALLDLDPYGLPHAQHAVDEVLNTLRAEPVELGFTRTKRAGMAAGRATVRTSDRARHRTWAQIAPAVSGLAARVFERLARAEAQVHGVAVEEIHFHEVGALDAIADIVGVCALVARLAPERVVVSTVTVGSGTVETAHGQLTVPGPAVTALLRGAPTVGGPVAHEACTPTGAALLAELADQWGAQPAMSVQQVGVGAGGRDIAERPNVLRVLTGAATTEASMYCVESTIDDLDPRVYPEVLAALKAAGAVEAWLTPVIMKHGRPAVTVTALAHNPDPVCDEFFLQTPTLGVRFYPVDRRTLHRDVVTTDLDGVAIRVKRGWMDGQVLTWQPEYVDVKAAADRLGIPVREALARLARDKPLDKKGSDATDGGDSDVRTSRT